MMMMMMMSTVALATNRYSYHQAVRNVLSLVGLNARMA